MTKVYVVAGSIDYEGDTVLAVFDDAAKAEEYRVKCEAACKPYADAYIVDEFELNQQEE